MSRGNYHYELNKLRIEEKYMISIANHIEDQISRLKVEEMALKSQLYIQENACSAEKELLSEKSDDDINTVPLNLGVSYMHNDDDEDDDDEEEEEEEDEDDENTAEVTQLSNFLDQLAQHQQQEGVEDENVP